MGVVALDMVVIGASTGGPVALPLLLAAVGSLPVPIIIVQHMPAGFTAPFAERLTRQCGFPFKEAFSGAAPVGGQGWVAPAERHLVVKRFEQGYNLVTHVGPPENSCRPAVDVLFRSVAEACGARALGVVLTGMGQDGLVGARLMRSAGADILVQDEASSVIWGMPGAIAKAGLAARVLPLAALASEIVLRVMRSQPRAARPPALGGPLRPASVERSG